MPAPSFDEVFAATRHSAVHLETRDEYTPDDPVFHDWRAGKHIGVRERWGDWFDLAAATTARGVEVRRARIVSEPVTDFIRYEHDLTGPLNLAAGEAVRWLPRRSALDISVPLNDFWVFDGELVRFGYFAGDGTYLGDEMVDDPAVVRLCVEAFERVWAQAIPHEDYRL